MGNKYTVDTNNFPVNKIETVLNNLTNSFLRDKH